MIRLAVPQTATEHPTSPPTELPTESSSEPPTETLLDADQLTETSAETENVTPVMDLPSAQQKTVAEKQKYPCRESAKCRRLFQTEKGLKQHIEICHTLESRLECQGCGKRFLRMQMLERHQAIHLKPPVVCQLCDLEVSSTLNCITLPTILNVMSAGKPLSTRLNKGSITRHASKRKTKANT